VFGGGALLAFPAFGAAVTGAVFGVVELGDEPKSHPVGELLVSKAVPIVSSTAKPALSRLLVRFTNRTKLSASTSSSDPAHTQFAAPDRDVDESVELEAARVDTVR